MTPGTAVPFTDAEMTKLVDYLENACLAEGVTQQEVLRDRIESYDNMYDAIPRVPKKNFPWPGAANLVVPLIAITNDSITARMLNTIFAVNPFWTIRPLRKEVEMIAKPCEQYMDWSRQSEYNLYRAVRPWVNQMVKIGWAWLKFGWEVYTTREYVTGRWGGIEARDRIVRRPVVYHVLAQDIMEQPGVDDDEQAEWICHIIRLTDNQLRCRKYDHIYEHVDEVMANKEDYSLDAERRKSNSDDLPVRTERLNTLYEFTIDYPYGPDDLPASMLITYHRPSQKVMRAVFNPYGFRMYKKGKFIEREGKREGAGIAPKLAHLQEELSTIHNQRLDNATIANTRFFLGKRNSVRQGTQIYPGKIVYVNDVQKDLVAMPAGESYSSMKDLEMSAMAYAERASGVSDYQLGRESETAGSRTTATGTLAIIQEGNRRFDLNIRDMRDVLSEVGKRVLELNQRFRPRGAAYFVQGADGVFTEQALDMPPEFSVAKLAVELTASTATVNKEVEKQSLIALFGFAMQYQDRLNAAVGAMANPQMPGEMRELIVKEIESMKFIMDRIVQTFDIKSIDTVVPVPPGMANGGGDQPTNGLIPSPGNPQGSTPDPGMGGILALLGESGAAGDPGAERLQ